MATWADEYKAVGEFLIERTICDSSKRAHVKEVARAYKEWARVNGKPIMGLRNLNYYMRLHGIKKKKERNGLTYWCLELCENKRVPSWEEFIEGLKALERR